MSSAEEHRCATEYVASGNPALAARLITANMRLVVTIALTYRRTSSDLHDLIQEGNMGLIQAVERYDRIPETAEYGILGDEHGGLRHPSSQSPCQLSPPRRLPAR